MTWLLWQDILENMSAGDLRRFRTLPSPLSSSNEPVLLNA